jgi:hypothetical protein
MRDCFVTIVDITMQQRSLAASLVAHKKCITRALQRDVCSAYSAMSCAEVELIFFVVGFKVTRCIYLILPIIFHSGGIYAEIAKQFIIRVRLP